MGIATVGLIALTAFQAVSQIKTSTKQATTSARNAVAKARALKAEGDIAVQERAKQVRLRAARQTSSFITSGLTLEGTPMDVLGETFDVGIADIENIGTNFQTSRMNVLRGGEAEVESAIRSGRNQAIGSIASSFSSFAGGSGAGSLFGSSQPANRGVGGVPIPVRKPTTGGFG